MDSERTHRSSSGSSTGELFICFTSRLSSSTSNPSSMKISSKSILSPGRTDKFREPQISLSSSLSRRLRSNGSMKGGQASPMFPAAGKKRGGAFENPEPSSPKVTCIGQVRVKTKKQGKKMRSRSKRRGEVSFRKIEHPVEGGAVHQGHGHHLQTQQECLPHRNQRWVHLPLTICEALRAFGADFNCFLPCRSSCTSGETEKEEKGAGENGGGGGGCAGSSSCGAVFARWLVALQEGEKGGEIELVVGEDDRPAEGFHRRHVLDDIEFKLEEDEAKDGALNGEEARVSICIPPKNALLLMRCRSDPKRMAALTNKFWEASLPQEEEEEDEDEDEDEDDARNEHQQVDMYTDAVVEGQEEGEETEEEEEEGRVTETKAELETAPELLDEVLEKRVSVEEIEEENSNVSEQRTTFVAEEEKEEEQDAQGDAPERHSETIELHEENQEKKEEEEVAVAAAQGHGEVAEELVPAGFTLEHLVDSRTVENEEIEPIQLLEDQEEQEEEEGDPAFPPDRRPSISSPPPPVPVHSEPEREDTAAAEAEALPEDEEERATVENKESEKSMVPEAEEEEGGTATHAIPDSEQDPKARETDKDEGGQKSNQRETQPYPKGETKAGAGAAVLPDCLLLMMCEPKLSMEVSRETWVCSTDFVRWHPDRLVKPTNGPDQPKTRLSTDFHPPQQHHLQPPRSSCSFPAAAAAGASMATMIEQKLVNAAAYEPFVLTRCKSEPMRSAAKLAPDPCFWKNRKLEPHRPRVGAAGVGF